MGVPCSAGGYGAAQITCVSLNNGLCAMTPPPPPPCPCVAAYRVGGNYADCETDYYSWNPATSRYESPRILRQICSGVCQTLNEECGSGIHWGETATSCVTTNGPCSKTPAPTPAPTPTPTPTPTPAPTPQCRRMSTFWLGSFRHVSEALAIRERWFAAGQPKGTTYRTILSGPGRDQPTNLLGCDGRGNKRIDCSYCGGCQTNHNAKPHSPGECDPAAACDNYPGCYGFVADFGIGFGSRLIQAFLCTDRTLETFVPSGPSGGIYGLMYTGKDSVREVANTPGDTWVAGPC